MPQLATSAVSRQFYRQTFEIKKNGITSYRHTLLINPDDMSIDEPNRASVTQTLGGAYMALFGQGLHNVTISGKTGFSARQNAEGVVTDGYEEIKALRQRLYRDFINDGSGQFELFWYNWEDEEYYKVMPISMRIQRSTSLGLLYRYDIQLTTLERLGMQEKPDPDNLLTGVDAIGKGKNIADASSAISEALYNAIHNIGIKEY